ncbi:MAG: hypothetical protein JJU16_09615 [Alkalibacterium sp.]|nr:hypothetical protein [Alkalibacterium sp.]
MIKRDQLKLPNTLSEGMIIQQNKPIQLSGKDKVGIDVTIEFNGIKEGTKADEKGDWFLTFPSMKAGGPYTLTVSGSSEKTVSDIYIGEVWLIGGQSNMELPINRTYDEFKEEIDAAHFPLIRQFHVEMDLAFEGPKHMMEQGEWKQAVQENIQDFSSLGFFYAKKLYQELNVAVGIIHTAVGGTPVEAWMKEETLRSLGNYDEEMDYWKDPVNVEAEIKKDAETTQTWYEDLNKRDVGYANGNEWVKENLDIDSWKSITVPFMFKDVEELKSFSGAIWFRRTFNVTEEDLQSQSYRIRLGSLINGDETYLNGKKIGVTEYRYPPRKYPITKSDLKLGTNTLVVRLSIDAANGGFIPSFPYQLELDHQSIDLTGQWRYKIGVRKEKIDPMLFLHYKPSVLYNAILYPLRHVAVRGFLFYQGESNTGQPIGYKELMKLMIADWRHLFSEELPFYYVQLANYVDPAADRDDHQWAVLRYEQDRVRFENKKVEMIPAYDCGISYELHPHDKKTLAHRLAEVALNRTYQIGTPYENVEISSITNDGQAIRLTLKHVEGNLVLSDKIPEFDIKLKDQWIEWADFSVSEQTVELSISDLTSETITGVRYAWRNDPRGYVYDSKTNRPLLPFICPLN